MSTNSGIYKLTNRINNKIYIGKANNLRERISRYRLSRRKDNFPIVQAIRKYGWENFEVSILEEFTVIDSLHLLEIESYWIRQFDATNKSIGYNVLLYSSDTTGYKHTEESKRKMSIARKQIDMSGSNNPMWGKKPRPESVKQAISKANKGKPAHNKKQIAQIDSCSNDIIKIWTSATEAAKGLNLSTTHVAAAARKYVKKRNGASYVTKKAGGFFWQYID